eukprot:1161500-Pelagomonas_calceolata.AAC.3
MACVRSIAVPLQPQGAGNDSLCTWSVRISQGRASVSDSCLPERSPRNLRVRATMWSWSTKVLQEESVWTGISA